MPRAIASIAVAAQAAVVSAAVPSAASERSSASDESASASGIRVGLRVLGALMLVAGLAIGGAFVVLGPADMAQAMGENCVHNAQLPSRAEESCTIFDSLELAGAAPILLLVGAVLVFALKRSNVRSDQWSPLGYGPR